MIPVVTRASGMLLGCVAIAMVATMSGRSRQPAGICRNRFTAPSGATLWWRLDRPAPSSSSSPVVVLTGDIGAGADVWVEAARQICGAGLDVLTYDRPGLGASRSARGRGSHSTLVHAADLAALLEQAAPGRSLLVAGVGFGATIGVLAASLLKRPAVAVVIDPSGLPAVAPVSPGRRADLHDRSVDAGLTSISLWLGGAAVRVPPQTDGADTEGASAAVRADRNPRLWGTLSREFSAAARFDAERSVHEGIPTTVLASRAFASRERETLRTWRQCSVLQITEPSWLLRSSAPMSAAVVSEFVRCIIGASG